MYRHNEIANWTQDYEYGSNPIAQSQYIYIVANLSNVRIDEKRQFYAQMDAMHKHYGLKAEPELCIAIYPRCKPDSLLTRIWKGLTCII